MNRIMNILNKVKNNKISMNDIKRKVSVLLIIAMLFNVFIVSENTNKATASSNTYPNNVQEFHELLTNLGMDIQSKYGRYTANFNTYKATDLLVYGSPNGETSSKNGERRYLGYTFLEQQYSNPNFPDDARGIIPYVNWNYLDVPGASPSWDPQVITDTQRDYTLGVQLVRNEGGTIKPSGVIINDTLKGNLNKVRLLSAPTYKKYGAVYVEHNEGAGKYYATFLVPPMGGNADVDATVIGTNITVDEKQEIVQLPIKVLGTTNPYGNMAKTDISKTNVRVTCDALEINKNYSQDGATVDKNDSITIYTEHLGFGVNTFVFTATGYSSDIYNDIFGGVPSQTVITITKTRNMGTVIEEHRVQGTEDLLYTQTHSASIGSTFTAYKRDFANYQALSNSKSVDVTAGTQKVVIYYKYVAPTVPEALLGVKKKGGSVTTEDGHVFSIQTEKEDFVLVDKSFYDNKNIVSGYIMNSKTNNRVADITQKGAEYAINGLGVGEYKYTMYATLNTGITISDSITFKVTHEQVENDSTLRVSSLINAPEAVLEVYNTATAYYEFEAKSNYELDDYEIIQGRNYVANSNDLDGSLRGYEDWEGIKITIPVKQNITMGVEVEDDSGKTATSYASTYVKTKEVIPQAGMRIQTQLADGSYTDKEYKEYRKIRLDLSLTNDLTDDDIEAYAPNNYNSANTVIEIQGKSGSSINNVRFANENVVTRTSDTITIKGDSIKSPYAYLRVDKSGYYRFRCKVDNGYKVSAWSGWYTVFIEEDMKPVINDIQIIPIDENGNEGTRIYNNIYDLWTFYRNEKDLAYRFKVVAAHTSPDGDNIDKYQVKVKFDKDNDKNITNDGDYSNMTVTQDSNNFVQIGGEDVFRVTNKSITNTRTEVVFKVSNTDRNIFGKTYFELQVEESPVIPYYIEGSLGNVYVVGDTSSFNNVDKTIYLDNKAPNLMVETEKLGGIGLYRNNTMDVSYYNNNLKTDLNNIYSGIDLKETKGAYTSNPARPLQTSVESPKILTSTTPKTTHTNNTAPYGHTLSTDPANNSVNMVGIYNDYIYYYDYGITNKKLYRMDRTNNEVICVYTSTSTIKAIHVYGGKVYIHEGTELYELNETSGTKTFIGSGIGNLIMIRSGYIFFTSGEALRIYTFPTYQVVYASTNKRFLCIDLSLGYAYVQNSASLNNFAEVYKVSLGGIEDSKYMSYVNSSGYSTRFQFIYQNIPRFLKKNGTDGIVMEGYDDKKRDYYTKLWAGDTISYIHADGYGGAFYWLNGSTLKSYNSTFTLPTLNSTSDVFDIHNKQMVIKYNGSNVINYGNMTLEFKERVIYEDKSYNYDFLGTNPVWGNAFNTYNGRNISNDIVQYNGYLYTIKKGNLYRTLIGDSSHNEMVAKFPQNITATYLAYHNRWFYFSDGLRIYKVKYDGSGFTMMVGVAYNTRWDGKLIEATTVEGLVVLGNYVVFLSEYWVSSGNYSKQAYYMHISQKNYMELGTESLSAFRSKGNLTEFYLGYPKNLHSLVIGKNMAYFIAGDNSSSSIYSINSGMSVTKVRDLPYEHTIYNLFYDYVLDNFVIRERDYGHEYDDYSITYRNISGSNDGGFLTDSIIPEADYRYSGFNDLYSVGKYASISMYLRLQKNVVPVSGNWQDNKTYYLIADKAGKIIKILNSPDNLIIGGHLYKPLNLTVMTNLEQRNSNIEANNSKGFDEIIMDSVTLNASLDRNSIGDNTKFNINGNITGSSNNLKVYVEIGGVKKSLSLTSSGEFNIEFNSNELPEGIYTDIKVYGMDLNNLVLKKVNIGNIKVDKSLSKLITYLDGIPKGNNGKARILVMEHECYTDNNEQNQALLESIKTLLNSRDMGLFVIEKGERSNILANFATLFTSADIPNSITTAIDQPVALQYMINYINLVRAQNYSNYFITGREEINFIKTFYDGDKDYKLSDSYTIQGKTEKMNAELSQIVRNEKENTLYAKFTHDPSVFDNPVPVYANIPLNTWLKIDTYFDGNKDKYVLVDNSGNNYVMKKLFDSMRGKWTTALKASDDTGNADFDKDATVQTEYYIHKAPVPLFGYTQAGNIVTLFDNGSYDLDKQYSLPNNGIIKYAWRYKVQKAGGIIEWIDAGEGAELKSIVIDKTGLNVIDYELTVWDSQGASSSISKDYLILDRPEVDFTYNIGSVVTNYAYYGNVGHESINVKTDINWNDEVYNPLLYSTSGTRSYSLTDSIYKMSKASEAVFSTFLNSKNLNSGILGVCLSAKNKLDMVAEINKYLDIRDVNIVNKTDDYREWIEEELAFPSSDNGTFDVFLNGSKVLNYSQLRVTISSDNLGIDNYELVSNNLGRYTNSIKLSNFVGIAKYKVNVYSSRTNELIAQQEYSILVKERPIQLELKNFRVTVLKDVKLADYFWNSVTQSEIEKSYSVNSLAIDSATFSGLPVTKGYKFKFKIDALGFNEANDKIRIIPHFYTVLGGNRSSQERDTYWEDSDNHIFRFGEGETSKYKSLTLTSSNRTIVDENNAIYEGEYLIPATAFPVNKGHIPKSINDGNLKTDIIVAFEIVGIKKTGETYNYNTGNWTTERTNAKGLYEVGDVIRYNYTRNGALDDIGVYRVR